MLTIVFTYAISFFTLIHISISVVPILIRNTNRTGITSSTITIKPVIQALTLTIKLYLKKFTFFIQMASQLYVNLTNLVEAHVKANIEQFLSESMDRQVFLKRMDDCWRAHCRQMIMIRSIFLYLDRTYVLQNPSIHSIW